MGKKINRFPDLAIVYAETPLDRGRLAALATALFFEACAGEGYVSADEYPARAKVADKPDAHGTIAVTLWGRSCTAFLSQRLGYNAPSDRWSAGPLLAVSRAALNNSRGDSRDGADNVNIIE